MDQVQYALWRFRNVEGVMDYVKKYDLYTCTLALPKTNLLVIFNPTDEVATITNLDNSYIMPIDCKFSEFVNTMSALGYYKERTVNRHSLSYKQNPEI